MEEKIKVAIAGFYNELAVAVAQAICRSDDMQLFNHGLSRPDFANRHLKIACVYMELYNMERKSLFFEKISEVDVLVDCFLLGGVDHAENLTFYNKIEIPVVILTSASQNKNIDKILDEIRFGYQKNSSLRIV